MRKVMKQFIILTITYLFIFGIGKSNFMFGQQSPMSPASFAFRENTMLA